MNGTIKRFPLATGEDERGNPVIVDKDGRIVATLSFSIDREEAAELADMIVCAANQTYHQFFDPRGYWEEVLHLEFSMSTDFFDDQERVTASFDHLPDEVIADWVRRIEKAHEYGPEARSVEVDAVYDEWLETLPDEEEGDE